MPAKNSLRDKNKTLTDFFAQRPSDASSPLATSTGPTATTVPTMRRRSAVRASTATAGRELSSVSPFLRGASTTSTRKRARSPDSINPGVSPFPPSKLKSAKKPSKVFQSGLDSKRLAAVICVTSSFPTRDSLVQRPAPPQVHADPLDASPSGSSKQFVCSSQSDEAELVLPILEPRDLGSVVESIHTWRQKTSECSHSSSPHAGVDDMGVDSPLSSPIRSSSVASARSASPLFSPRVRSTTSRNSVAFQTPTAVSACLPSPLDTKELLLLPPTPEPLDSEAKTAKLIAEIKARAFATNQSSDDERPLIFRELEDSEDGDLDDDLPLIGNIREKPSLHPAAQGINDMFSSPLSSVPSMFNDATVDRRTHKNPGHSSTPLRLTRTSTRTRKPMLASRAPAAITESSSTSRELKSGFVPPNHKKSQATNPLHALLREKELEVKRGTSCAALRLAEEVVQESSREESISAGDEFDSMNRLCLADEQAAWKAVHESRRSTSPAGPDDVEDFVVGDRESRMLGVVAGEAINKIFAGDKDGKGKENALNADQKTTSSFLFWERASDDDIQVDPMSTLPLSGHPILTCLDRFLRNGDDSFGLILRSGTLAVVPEDVLLSNIPQFLHMALFASSQIADAVYVAFRDLWGMNAPKVQLSFVAILGMLVWLGASTSILEGLGLHAECGQRNNITQEAFLEALKRFLAIVRAAGFAGAFSSDDIANVVLILAAMALDPLTSGELRMQLNITINVVCDHGAPDHDVHGIHERVLALAGKLIPVDKARLVSFFASGSGRTRHIARHLAYRHLVPAVDIPDDRAPPLEPLILLLSPDAGSGELFDITDESTDYVEIRHHIDILSVALIDIEPYVTEERVIMKSAASASVQRSPSKSRKPPVPPLELLRKVLEDLQSKIIDIRAAHLDRSRTKAAIQRLTMRIYYDRMALMGTRSRPRTSTLKAYFSPQR